MILSVSWRNVWRNKLRSLVVILAIALGLFGSIFMIAVSNGWIEQKVYASISNEISNIQIHDPRFLEDKSINFTIDHADSIVHLISQTPGVKAVCKRIKTTAMASTANSGNGVIISGIIPEKEKLVTDIHQKLVEGNYFEKRSRTSSILISKKLAEKLKAKPGSKVVITIQSRSGDISYGLFRVAGIYKTSNAIFDEMNVFVENHSLVELIGLDPDKTSEIAILLDNNDLTDQVTNNLKDKFKKLSVLSWKETDPSLVAIITLMDQYSYIMIVIILFALTFGIVNAMLMSILERTREIGMLMAIGMNKRKVFMMILMETMFLSVTGAVLGIFLSIITVGITGKYGINFASVAEGLEALGYSAFVYPTVKTMFYIIITITVIITAGIASIWPARKALKLQPASAIREDI
jgi:ABC-type lipoprotein release transport system permease subunit